MKKHFDVGTIIQTVQSDYQLIQVAQHPTHGKVLLLDGNVQLTEKDEHLYHDQIMNLIPYPNRGYSTHALVIGGGDGYLAKRLVKKDFLVDVVEIDKWVTDISREYFVGNIFDDGAVRLEVMDAIDYVKSMRGLLYDVIVLDITDPPDYEKETELLSVEFLTYCSVMLQPGGVIVVQSGCPINNKIHYDRIVHRMKILFNEVRCSTRYVESYGEHQSFVAGYAE